MSSEPRLQDVTEFERRLLEAASAERPGAELSARMASALGLPPLGPGMAPVPAAKLATGWVSVGVLVATLGGGAGVWALLRSGEETRATPNAAPAPSPPATLAPSRAVPTHAAAEAAATSTMPAPAATAAASSRESKAALPPSTGERGDLRAEIRLIDAARSALAGRSPEQALSALRRYATQFPSGTFGQEAAVLRIEALAQSGQRGRARVLAREFVAKHPRSPLADRLRTLAAESEAN